MSTNRRQFCNAVFGAAVAGCSVSCCFRQSALYAAPAVTRFPTVARIRQSDPAMWQLVDHINAYRKTQSLSAISLSPRLTAVAWLHAKDLAANRPNVKLGNLHSWSDDPRWNGGAYAPNDKSTWKIMWEKPKEIAGYGAFGFEICAAGARDMEHSLQLWKASNAHHDVILNRGIWADSRWTWRALGAAFYQGFACAWFGNQPDDAAGDE